MPVARGLELESRGGFLECYIGVGLLVVRLGHAGPIIVHHLRGKLLLQSGWHIVRKLDASVLRRKHDRVGVHVCAVVSTPSPEGLFILLVC